MHAKSLIVGAALAASVALAAGRVFGDDPPKAPPSREEVERLLKPGPAQEALKAFEGAWEFSGTYSEEGMPAPMAYTGTATNKMILGGRFLERDETMNGGPMVMHNLGFVGHDVMRGVFMSYAMGDTSAQPPYTEGKHDAAKKATVNDGVEAMAPGMTRKYQIVVTDVAEDSYKVQISFDSGSGMKKAVDSTYKRKK